MEDYHEMYMTLFVATSKAIEDLQKAQLMTEEMFAKAEEPIIHLFPPKQDNEE
ncbi:MAG: hypothetical protein FWE69_07410 [Clostridiales bacterium]|nr:hypothetical protein [Clostridiales bacterium]